MLCVNCIRWAVWSSSCLTIKFLNHLSDQNGAKSCQDLSQKCTNGSYSNLLSREPNVVPKNLIRVHGLRDIEYLAFKFNVVFDLILYAADSPRYLAGCWLLHKEF